MGKLVKGVHHIALRCDGVEMFEKAVSFYHETLQMEIVRRWGEGEGSGIMIETGNSVMEIFAGGRLSESTGSINHMAFAVDDVDACIDAVRGAGYEVTQEPHDIVIPSAVPFPARIAFCIGPVGEEIEFFCEK